MSIIGDHVLEVAIKDFEKYKSLAEQAFAQLSDEDFHWLVDEDQNSLAVIVQHMSGNLRSRWTDFLTADGEKPDRHRDQEFIELGLPRDELMRRWKEGWACLFAALIPLTGDDLLKTVYIRREHHTVFQAINRQTSHYAYHVGQIIQLARQIKGEAWQPLSVPRGKSEEFNRRMGMG